MRTWDEQKAIRPPDPERVAQAMAIIERRQTAYRLQELRKELGLTQVQLAKELGVTQHRVSRIESGELDNAQLATLRRYVSGLGGELTVSIQIGAETYRVA